MLVLLMGAGPLIRWRRDEARDVLRPGGELRIIGNRHLNYHLSLKKLFGFSRFVTSTFLPSWLYHHFNLDCRDVHAVF